MHTVIAIVLLASVMQTRAENLAENHATSAQDSLDKWLDKLLDRASEAWPIHHRHLEETSLAKTHPVSIPKPYHCLVPHHQVPIPFSQIPISISPFPILRSLPILHAHVEDHCHSSAAGPTAEAEAVAAEGLGSRSRRVCKAAAKINVAAEGLGRRSLLSCIASSLLTVGTATAATEAPFPKDADWPLWTALPLAPYSKRRTIRLEAGPGVWTFEQLFGTLYVYVPIRMTVIAMESGGLFVYAPAAPTRECLTLLQPLIDQHGPIKYIVLPSAAVEHAVLAGPFARAFPSAEVYTTDKRYSYPLDLPPELLGFPRKPKLLPSSSQGLGLWDGEFEHEVLTVKVSSVSSYIYQEAAFFHKRTKTLMVMDAIEASTAEPPSIITSEPDYIRALLFHARDSPLEKVVDSPEVRRKGWKRIALFANFLMPGATVSTIAEPDTYLQAAKSPMPELGYGGVLPFYWRKSWPASWEAFSADGKPAVPANVQVLMSRAPEATQRWVDAVTKWEFERVVPVHFDAPLAIGPPQFAEAFDWVRSGRNKVRFCDEDIAFLRDALDGLPPFAALYETKLGSLRGPSCGLV